MAEIEMPVALRLSALLGPRGLLTDPADLEPHLSDWRALYRGLIAAGCVRAVDEVSATPAQPARKVRRECAIMRAVYMRRARFRGHAT